MMEEFEKDYDSRRYAFENYYSWIESPLLIQQGDADEWCQVAWQKKVISGLKSEGKSAELVIYPGNDHNLSRSWNEVVQKGLVFYKREFGK
jgi:dipeptidyl aminopeptidase/acylaminoacyl peptidase